MESSHACVNWDALITLHSTIELECFIKIGLTDTVATNGQTEVKSGAIRLLRGTMAQSLTGNTIDEEKTLKGCFSTNYQLLFL